MRINVHRGEVSRASVDAIAVAVYQGEQKLSGPAKTVDKALDGAISDLLKSGEVRGKPSELTLVHTLGRMSSPRVLLVGLGKPEKLTTDVVRNAAADAARRARSTGARSLAFEAFGLAQRLLEPSPLGAALVEGAMLGLYEFDRHKSNHEEPKRAIDILSVYVDDGKAKDAIERGAVRGRILAEATNFARDLANEPANHLTPSAMAERARSMAKEHGLDCRILERADMEKLGMGSALSVANGSVQPPKFIVLEYRGGGRKTHTLGLVGKGITFDTGGISIKPAAGMEEMKGDMSGGAAVIAAMQAIAQLKPKLNVTALVPATENMPSGSATKPGDVVRAMNGKTIEVINTDAEGRLILADALAYANQLGLSPLIDVATLTGACAVALGNVATGAMTNDEALLRDLMAASEQTGEKLWQLPMFDEYEEQIKSDVADIKNTGGREAGAITAARFLAHFAGDTPWVHLDMAGTDTSKRDRGVWTKGATGIPVRTLVSFALAWAEKQR
ncbi:MAG TPA: leucyl aminopeptidase [Dehalococcoidia bacterium]|nr:leucyl aminopeptidase [Dehalococcoidia bacterium]